MNEQPPPADELTQTKNRALAVELEQLGDQALASDRFDAAHECYEAAGDLMFEVLFADLEDEPDYDRFIATSEDLQRIRDKEYDVSLILNPPPYLAERLVNLPESIRCAVESGDVAGAARISIMLSEAQSEAGDHASAESALRQAVMFARQVDPAMADVMLWAFSALIEFLDPSEESIALAQELGKNLIERDNMYHPMRAAEAALCWAYAELNFAEHQPHRIDHAVNAVARHAMDMLDDTCLHAQSQQLQRGVAEILRRVGHDIEAEYWQNKADEYEDWEPFMDQQIPGHVHLWDIRGDVGS